MEHIQCWLNTLDKKRAKLAVSTIAALWLVHKTWRAQRSRGMAPGRFQLPGIGDTLSFALGPSAFMSKGIASYGGSFFASILFNPTTVLDPTPENLKFFTLQRNLGWPEHWADVVGQHSVAMVNEPYHKKMRAVSGRAFTAFKLDTYLPMYQAMTKKHLEKWTDLPSGSDSFDHIKLYTFELAQKVILGSEMKDDECKEMMHDFKISSDGLACLVPVDLPGFPYHACMKARRKLGAKYQELIEQKRAERSVNPSSMLDYVMTAEDASMPSDVDADVVLQDFCYTMAFAGHDTTLATMQNMLHLLGENKVIAEELRAEVTSLWNGESEITRALLNQLHKCRAFTLECLRIIPPLQTMFRKLDADTTLPAEKYAVPSGTTIAVGVKSVMDRNTDSSDQVHLRNWLDDTGRFKESSVTDFSHFSAFGAGGRMCLGYKFAMDEMQVFLLTLLHSYDFEVVKRKKECFPFNFCRVWTNFSHRALS